MSDPSGKLYWDPLRDDRWDLSLRARRGAAGDTWYVIRRDVTAAGGSLSSSSSSSLHLVWKNGSTVCSSLRTFISPHLCGLGCDDLGFLPLQPSCHLGKDGGRRREKWDREGKEGAIKAVPACIWVSGQVSSWLMCLCWEFFLNIIWQWIVCSQGCHLVYFNLIINFLPSHCTFLFKCFVLHGNKIHSVQFDQPRKQHVKIKNEH